MDITQFYNTYEIENFYVSDKEEKIIFSTNLTGSFNLWALDMPNKFPYPLTFIDQNNYGIVLNENKKSIIASFDSHGNENIEIHTLPIEGGKSSILFGEENECFYLNYLSNNGEKLYYTTTKGNDLFLDAYVYDLKNMTNKKIYEGRDYPITIAAVSSSEDKIVITKQVSNTHITGHLLYNDHLISIVPEESKDYIINDIDFINNDDIYLVTNYCSDFAFLSKYSVLLNEFSCELIIHGEDMQSFQYNKVSESLFIVTTKGVVDKLYEYSLIKKALYEIDIPVDVIEQTFITKKGNLYILGRSAVTPQNIYYRDYATGKWDYITNNKVMGINKKELVDPEIITYESFDGLEIESLFYMANPKNTNNHTIVWIHGGPQSCEQKLFIPLFQFLLSKGYSLFAPNYRGSTGYGLNFTKLVEKNWGNGPRLDIISGLDYLIKNKIVDKEKIFTLGGSYGGYMALLLLGKHPNYFKAGVDLFGPVNLISFIERSPRVWKNALIELIGDPITNRDSLIEQSPITYIDQINKPLLVIQGVNDPRVDVEESENLIHSLKNKNIDIDFLFLENEGHGFSKKSNQIKAHKTIYSFLKKNTY
ncbi:S9 family peptidase [Bacillus chungangensis]|uniref:Dipeptidyl aminopeptidase/acylaminoacyl peptidase n=1 Tax=Bacillus chungangensis TaxID=587633 RepID=A0ABT9WSH4_9BACI|nr:prolyl oligopeptidase family serine peptidase [Bacillus chungangensis]MDQ0176244.1 dipeptidyl aminopeptidase/acylaminoacyl peptidase [Bacillus chungangensis]